MRLNRNTTAKLLACILSTSAATSATTPGYAADPPPPSEEGRALEQLLENVRYWQARNRPDKAAEAWRKVLKSVPNHAEGLAEMALFAARAGRNDEARDFLERLKKAHPQSGRIAGLEQALGLGAKYDDFLGQARAAVKAGRISEGVELYRKIFGGQTPGGAVALEFYQTLGGTAGGWEEARVGLERLASENPGDARFAVAAARHLTYVEGSRREGIERLERLAAGAEAKSATAAWRQALIWLLIVPSDFPTYDKYLSLFPNDEAVKTRLAEARSGVAQRTAAEVGRERLKAGYDALDTSAIDEAELIFRKAVKANPRDLEAMTGLGNALLKKEHFEEAKDIFVKVRDGAPRRRELWEDSLRSAEFWSLVKKAEVARAEGRPADAEPLLRDAMAKSPADAGHAQLVLGLALADEGRFGEAQATLEEVIGKKAEPGALAAMVELLMRKGDAKAALETNAKLAEVAPDKAYKEGALRAELARRDAVEKRKAGLTTEAEAILDGALAQDPEHRASLLDRAYVELDLGKLGEARRSLDALKRLLKDDAKRAAVAPKAEPGKTAVKVPLAMGSGPKSVTEKDAKVAEAWVLAGEARFDEGLGVLEGVKDSDLDAGTRTLKRRLRIQADLSSALKLAGRGKLISAQARLTELQRATKDEPELAGLVANAWADMGKYDQALALMYEALTAQKKETPTLKLQLAAILHKADREAELLSVLRELEGESELTAPEQQGLASLKIAYSVKRADLAREGGYLARAFNLLQDPLRNYPDDPRLMTALGRLFLSAGEYTEASELFAKVLATKADDLEARQGAIQSAVQMGREDDARGLAADGLKLSEDDPRMHLVTGRMHVLLGEDGEAMDSFERALALEEGRMSPELAPDSSVSKLLAGAERRFGNAKKGRDDDISLHREIAREIEGLRARHAVRLGTSAGLRVRPGTAGTSQLLALDFPTWISIPTGYRGRLTLSATPVLFDAGTLDFADPEIWKTFGTVGFELHDGATGTFGQSMNGIELSLAEEIGAFRIDVGSSPLGFPRQTIVGGLTWNDTFGPVGLRLDGHRRMVTESLLSWGGARDQGTEVIWGGVTKNGGRLDLGLTVDDVTWYLVGGGDWISGLRVEQNWSVEAGTGLGWRLYDWDGLSFGTGLDVSTMFFDKNRRFFTMGHGGYFSPQTFVSAGFPLRAAKTGGDLTYKAQASLGLVWFKEDAAPYYPTDPERQQKLGELVDEDGNPEVTGFPARERFGFALNVDAQLAYEVSRGFKVGVGAKVHTGPEYQEYAANLFIGYIFQQKVAAPGDRSTPFGEE